MSVIKYMLWRSRVASTPCLTMIKLICIYTSLLLNFFTINQKKNLCINIMYVLLVRLVSHSSTFLDVCCGQCWRRWREDIFKQFLSYVEKNWKYQFWHYNLLNRLLVIIFSIDVNFLKINTPIFMKLCPPFFLWEYIKHVTLLFPFLYLMNKSLIFCTMEISLATNPSANKQTNKRKN